MSASADPNFMMSLARGLAVLRAFTGHRRRMSVSDIARETGLSRASARRCLYTLVQLGYVSQDQGQYALLPRVLGIGHAYLSSVSISATAQPYLDRARDTLQESCSLGVFDGDELLYLARAETSRIMSIALRAGSRLPAYCTSMGRILLAAMAPAELDAYLARISLQPRTERSITDADALRKVIDDIRSQGYALVDQELEPGLRSVAVPVRNPHGEVVAALNMGTQPQRWSLEQLQQRAVPELHRAAQDIGQSLVL